MAFRLWRSDGAADSGPVQVELSYNAFRFAGAGLADRLRLLRLPASCLSDPDDLACIPAPSDGVPLVNDLATGTLTATIDAAADPVSLLSDPVAVSTQAGGPTTLAEAEAGSGDVFVLASASSGDAGNYKATDLRASGSWTAGTSAGDFSYEYPIPLPPSVGGQAPSLALSYGSQAVDGMTASQNPQVSWIGVGWDLSAGYIERRYKPCTWDGHSTWGDLCWHSPYSDKDEAELVLNLNGRSTKLIFDGTNYRVADEPGWLVEHLTGGPNGENNGEYWRITDLDGTHYTFGYGKKQEGYTGTAPDTNSVWTVPVYSDDAGEPHTQNVSYYQGWRWNLDRVVDANENATVYTYARETDYYKRFTTGVIYSYHRGGTLSRVEYGLQAGELIAEPPAKVSFSTNNRCSERVVGDPRVDPLPSCPSLTAANAASFPDVPVDLICTATVCSRTSPTFFSSKWLERVDVDVLQADGTGYDEAYDVWLRHNLATGDGSVTTSLLDWVRAVGKYGSDPDVVLPVTDFGHTLLSNRVDWTASVSKLSLYRVSTIETETGGTITATYTGPSNTTADTCPFGGSGDPGYGAWQAARGSWDTQHYLCAPSWYTPEGAAPGFGTFHTYVVTRVVEADPLASSPDVTTTYDYLGGAAWAYDKDPLKANCGVEGSDGQSRTWNDFRGYQDVKITVGTGANSERHVSETRFFRGMDADPYVFCNTFKEVGVTNYLGTEYEDNLVYAGRPLQTRTYRLEASGSTLTELASQRSTFWLGSVVASMSMPGASASAARYEARLVREANQLTREQIFDASGNPTGTWQDFQPYSAVFDPIYGLETQVKDFGQTGVDDNTCTTISYAQNTTASVYLINNPVEEAEYDLVGGSTCPGTGTAIAKTVTLYDGSTNPTAQTLSDGNPTEVRTYTDAATYLTTKATYDNYGRGVSETDGRGKITNTVYTPAAARPVATVAVTNPLGHVSTSWRSAATGAETKMQDANNQITEYDYDPLGRLIRAWSPTEPRAGGNPSARFTYTLIFDGATGPVTAPPRVLSETLQSGTTYLPSYTYLDGLGRERESQTPSATGTGRTIVATYFDTRGQVATVSRPFYNSSAAGSGLHNAAISALPTATASVYDSLGREVAAITKASGVEQWRTSTTYRGDRTVVTPPTGGATEMFVNADSDTVKITEDVGASTADTLYTYTPRGELASIDPPGTGANTITRGYDWAGRQTSSNDPDAGSLTSVLDGNGNVTKTTDALGHVIETVYDDLNRPTQRDVTPFGGAKTTAATWAYDTGVANAIGRLVTTTAITGGQNYITSIGGYDGRGRAASTTVTIPPSEGNLAGSYQFSYGYDAANHQTSLTYPGAGGLAQETVTTGYSTQGAPNTLSGLAIYVTGTTWRGDALLGGRTYGQAGGQSLSRGYTFDTVGRLATITTSLGAGLSQDDRYAYDNSGNTTSIHDAIAEQRECFGYDDAQRLASAYTTTAGSCAGYVAGGPDPYNQSWTYTPDGNIATATSTAGTATYSYGAGLPTAGPHAVTGVSGGGRNESYGYDQAGQMLSRTVSGVTTGYTWDAQHRLASANVAGSGSTSMVYDADGQRLIRTLPNGSKTLYLPGMELVASEASVTGIRYYSDGTGTVVAMRTTAGLTWLANSPQASTQIAVDAATGVVSRQRYLPHGGKRGAGVLPTQRGWLGQTADDTTGLVYLNARYYDPNLARFLTPDPLVDLRAPQLSNPYTYAGNNPTTYTDPTGLMLMSDGGGAPKKKSVTTTKKKSTSGKSKGKTKNYAPIRVPKQKRDMEKLREKRERTRQIIAKRSGKGARVGRTSSPGRPSLDARRNQLLQAANADGSIDQAEALNVGYMIMREYSPDEYAPTKPLSPFVGSSTCVIVCGAISIQDGHVQIQAGGVGLGGHAAMVGATSARVEEQGLVQDVGCVAGVVGGCIQHGDRTAGGEWFGGTGVVGIGGQVGKMVTVVDYDFVDGTLAIFGFKIIG